MELPPLTPHPTLHLPTAEEAQAFIAARGAQAFADWCNQREEKIRMEQNDPYRHGLRPPIWDLVDDLLCEGKRVCLDFSKMYQGLYAYDYDYEWMQHQHERVKRQVAQFPKEIVTSGATELLIMGDNRSGKTEYAAWKYVDTLMGGRERIAWALQQSAKSSIHLQQQRVAKYLPVELRAGKDKRSSSNFQTTKIRFGDAGGFTDSVFVLPNRSKGLFYYYGQKLKEVEGNELDFVWADELIPMQWISAVRSRLIDRNGLFLLTFTPVEGYTPEVKEFRKGCETLAEVPMRFFPGESKPKLERKRDGSAHVVYFHSLHDNYYSNRTAWLRSMNNRTRNYTRRRGEGIAEATHGVKFPIFKHDVHVCKPDAIPSKGTSYHYCDPGDGKPWCNFWLRVDARGHIWIYREWPCQKLYVPGWGYVGPWATDEPDIDQDKQRADGYPGEGQSDINWGVKRYKEEFARLEDGEPLDSLAPVPGAHGSGAPEDIYERQMDSRARNRRIASGGDEGTSLVELCEDHDLYFEPASGKQIDDGIDLVSDWLYYDETRPIEPFTNEPKLHICEECENLIWALEHWTGKDGQKGACKDWIDLLRYAAQSDPVYVPERESRNEDGGYY